MRLSFFCAHCKTHLNSGDHRKCKRILQKQRREEAERLRSGEQARKQYEGARHNKELLDYAHRHGDNMGEG